MVIALPGQRINIADLVPVVQSSTGVYVYYVETPAPTTPASKVCTENTAKPEVDFTLVEKTCNACYIAGITRFSKQMAQDLPFLTSFLPTALRREYWKAENKDFFTILLAAATASTGTAGGVVQIIGDIGVLEGLDYDPNGIVMNPADYATLLAACTQDSQSCGVTYTNNEMFINGVPVFKASWVTAGDYVVGDWSYARKIVVDGLSVEFFEQDQDNVVKNMITARVEARVCFAVEAPAAFIKGKIAATT